MHETTRIITRESSDAKNDEALIGLEEEIRASQESPVKEPYTGKQEFKGNKFPYQQTQTSVC